MSVAATSVYGEPASIEEAVTALGVLAGDLLLATGEQGRVTSEVLACWQGEAAEAFLAAQAARAHNVAALLEQLLATRSALEALARELATARAGVRRVIDEAEALGLRVRDDARAVYLPADFSTAHPDALAAREQAARLTAQLTAIWWAAQEAWGVAAARLRALHPEPMPSHAQLRRSIGTFVWQQVPSAITSAWLAPLAMAEGLAERDPEAAAGWARRQRLARLGKLATATGRGTVLLGRVPMVRDVPVLGAALNVVGTIKEIRGGTDPGVAVSANAGSGVTAAAAGGVTAVVLEATPVGLTVTAAVLVGMGVGSAVHWALETAPVRRAVTRVRSAVTSRFAALVEEEQRMLQRLATAG